MIFLDIHKIAGLEGAVSLSKTCIKMHRVFNDKILWRKFYKRMYGIRISIIFPKENYKIIKSLTKKFPELSCIDNKGNTALHHVTSMRFDSQFHIFCLHEHKISLFKVNNYGQTPLHTAADVGNYEASNELLKLSYMYRPDYINFKDYNGRTALHIAAGNGNTKICKLLIEYSASITELDINNQTPLHYSCKYNQIYTSKYIASLYKISDINIVDSQGNTALLLAASKNYQPIVIALIELCADIFIENKTGYSLFKLLTLPNILRDSKLEKYIKDRLEWTPMISKHGYKYENNTLDYNNSDFLHMMHYT